MWPSLPCSKTFNLPLHTYRIKPRFHSTTLFPTWPGTYRKPPGLLPTWQLPSHGCVKVLFPGEHLVSIHQDPVPRGHSPGHSRDSPNRACSHSHTQDRSFHLPVMWLISYNVTTCSNLFPLLFANFEDSTVYTGPQLSTQIFVEGIASSGEEYNSINVHHVLCQRWLKDDCLVVSNLSKFIILPSCN